MELFESNKNGKYEPLASRLRPQTLKEFIGQKHILGAGKLLRRAIQLDQLSSLIFWGPPGSGKTTLAKVIANSTKSFFTSLNAVLAGVKEVREVVEQAQKKCSLYQQRTILFVDEVHRWNKSQQDALLPWVENGTIILIGATTENPFFSVNSALLSRSRVFQLKKLSVEELKEVAERALNDSTRGYGKYRIEFEPEALAHLIKIADGDARSLLNAIELAVETTPNQFPPPPGEIIKIDLKTAEESIQKKALLYDREGDYHYDTISAFIKSLRGSDPDAAFYWLARMVAAGEDPAFLFRRMLIFACEDIGLADPQALIFVNASAQAFERVGMPEGRFHLAQAALYLATAPKSNSVLGFFDALKVVEEQLSFQIPNHLKDASRDAKGFGHGEGYLYPHAYHKHWVAQQYLPTELKGRIFYKPAEIGFEGKLKDILQKRREAQLEAIYQTAIDEELVFIPAEKQLASWLTQAQGDLSKQLEDIRGRIFAAWPIRRHFNFIDLKASSGLLVWEARRRFSAGLTVALVENNNQKEIIENYSQELPELLRPVVKVCPLNEVNKFIWEEELKGVLFEAVAGRDLFLNLELTNEILSFCKKIIAQTGKASFAEKIPASGQKLSDCLADFWPAGQKMLEKIEKLIFGESSNNFLSMKKERLLGSCEDKGFKILKADEAVYFTERFLTFSFIEKWFNSSYRLKFSDLFPESAPEQFLADLKSKIDKVMAKWKTTVLFFCLEK